jgi:hypothetical protein
VEEGGESLRLGMRRKSPRVMGEIINHIEIVFITRETRDKRSLRITVNKIKGIHRMRRRKRQTNMVTQLAHMAEMLTRSPSARKMCTTTELSQHVATRVTEPAVPGRGRGSGGKSSRGGRWYSGSRNAKVVKGSRAVTAESGRSEAQSFTIRPEGSNSTEQELPAVN